jgi:hypothetical protein
VVVPLVTVALVPVKEVCVAVFVVRLVLVNDFVMVLVVIVFEVPVKVPV